MRNSGGFSVGKLLFNVMNTLIRGKKADIIADFYQYNYYLNILFNNARLFAFAFSSFVEILMLNLLKLLTIFVCKIPAL